MNHEHLNGLGLCIACEPVTCRRCLRRVHSKPYRPARHAAITYLDAGPDEGLLIDGLCVTCDDEVRP